MRVVLPLFCLLIIGCTSFKEEHQDMEDTAILQVKEFFQIHGGDPGQFPDLFDKNAPISARLADASAALKWVWIKLEDGGHGARQDAMAELSLHLSWMLSYHMEND